MLLYNKNTSVQKSWFWLISNGHPLHNINIIGHKSLSTITTCIYIYFLYIEWPTYQMQLLYKLQVLIYTYWLLDQTWQLRVSYQGCLPLHLCLSPPWYRHNICNHACMQVFINKWFHKSGLSVSRSFSFYLIFFLNEALLGIVSEGGGSCVPGVAVLPWT